MVTDVFAHLDCDHVENRHLIRNAVVERAEMKAEQPQPGDLGPPRISLAWIHQGTYTLIGYSGTYLHAVCWQRMETWPHGVHTPLAKCSQMYPNLLT
jgi:hypothetical protein